MTLETMSIRIEKYLKFFFVIKVMYTIDYTPYKFLDWIEQHKLWLDRSELERCPKFLYLLEKEKEIFIRWIDISRNPNAIHLL